MLVIAINKKAKNVEGQMIYGENAGDHQFVVEFELSKFLNDGPHLVFYFIDYSLRHHSSIHDDVTLENDAYSIRFAFYLTADMASWAKYLHSLTPDERKKHIKNIFNI